MIRHYEETTPIPASPKEVFNYVDDHSRFSSHMNQSSWMLGGGKMETFVDAGNGQKVGSHIRMAGRALGISLSLDEVVTRHEPPKIKTWETVGIPELLVIGSYRMGVEIKPHQARSRLKVFIDYDLPPTHVWLGKLFAGFYAAWCVRQMLATALKSSSLILH